MKKSFPVVSLFVSGIILALSFVQCKSKGMKYFMIVGTYTNTDSKGIYIFDFDSGSGKTSLISTTDGIKNPSYLTVAGDRVYAVSETNGAIPGSLSAYHFDRKVGTLRFLNNLPTGGDDPCYVEADRTGKFVAVANYSGGSVALFQTDNQGPLQDNKLLIQHHGGSINPERQMGPHVHESVFSPDQKYLLTPDLGMDRVVVYRFDKDSAIPLKLYKEIVSEPGTGPRHIAFHPFSNFAYLIHEMLPVVTVYKYEGGDYTQIQEIPTWPEGFDGVKDGAELMVSPDGRFLYISNRGNQNTIGVYAIDPQTGKLTNKGFQAAGGTGPRDFQIDPTGRFLLVANQQTNNIVTFKINRKTGMLKEVQNLEIPVPVCIKFAEKL